MGTPDLAVAVLDELARKHDVVGVFTRPDAVRGRGGKLVASPVKQRAEQLDIPVFTPASLKDESSIEILRELEPDFICVSAYGVILPSSVLEIPKYDCINVHTSLLPRWRGAAPIERSILANDEVTGVSIMRMDEGLDTGDYCVQSKVAIGDSNAEELSMELGRVGAEALIQALDDIARDSAVWHSQGHEGITYAEKLSKGELALDPKDTSRVIVSKAQASSSAHPARARIADRPLAVERAGLVDDAMGMRFCADIAAGQARFAAKRLFIGASDGPVEVLQVKPDGKKSMDARSFAGGIQGVKNKELTWGRA